ncbi:hypothetical protein [uncultured Selenomonas sp.]|uniref:hypothetical protein n=1 Tax=uncultured Selenomonas sp. TaxID=159275 RepID=UPI0025D4BBB0|nr:hypothetical protein [uncultured Selenomonas sp.]
MSVSLADVQQQHGYTHGYPVEVGADPFVTAICDGDIRAAFARDGTPPYRRLLDVSVEELEQEASKAESALQYLWAWGFKTAI